MVGYQKSDAPQAYSLFVPSFEGIGTTTYSIQDLKPIVPDGGTLSGAVFDLQTLDEFGGMSEQFVYMTTEDGVAKDGWYNDDMETFASKTFSRAEGFMFNNSTGDDAGLLFAGEVNTNEVTVVAEQAYSLKGNLRPYSVSIQNLVPVVPKGGSVSGAVFDLQTLDEFGGMSEQFVYMTTEDGVDKDGWYNDDMETFATKVFEPSEGFMLNNSTGAEASLKFK